MKRTQAGPDRDDYGPTLPPTEKEPTAGDATQNPTAASALETGEFTEVGATNASGTQADGDRSRPVADGGQTASFALSPSQGNTEPITAADATLDAPATGGRDNTVSFELNAPDEDSMKTLPPGAETPEDKMPRVAGFEILEVLGVGGMGIVYKARQVRLDRFVALKMIRAGAGARPQDLTRFESEALAVAAIEHPNIIRIFEIGEYGGMPFCSLEYLAGGSLAKKIGGKPQPVDQAASIVETLAGAMATAHRGNIIHRDLKPANVLLASDGTLKITDFGLAKRLEGDSSQTRSGSILGTPSYMSPEQARGETHSVGPAADQYALGAILYELLTGRPPFQGTSVLDTLDQVRKKEPVPPSQLQPKMPRDIETICLKCLEKEPARRYHDVAALAEDLHRFRAGKPILARPVSAPERLWRWCLRNKGVAALGAAVLLLMMTVAAVLAVGIVTVSRRNEQLRVANVALVDANARAEAKQREAEEQHLEADRKRKLAEAAARAANEQNRVAVDAEIDMITLLEQRLRHVPALQDVREKMLDDAVKNLDAAAQAMTDLRRDIGWDPKNEDLNWRSLARARQRLGESRLAQGRFKDAMEQFQRMEAIVATLAASKPDDLAAQARLARTQRMLGFVAMKHLVDIELAKQYFRRAIDISRECLTQQPDSDAHKNELASSLGYLAAAEMQLGHLKEARDIYREEITTRESFSPDKTRQSESIRELAGLYERLADLSFKMGDKNEARRLYDHCASLRQHVAADRPDFWPVVNDLAMSLNNAGFIRFPQGDDPAAAREFHKKAIALYEKRVELDPNDFDARGRLATTLYYEATCALHSHDQPAAEAGYRRCLEIRKALVTIPKAKMPQVEVMLALARCGEHGEAAKIAESLVAGDPLNEQVYFQSACGYALAAGAATGHPDLARRYTDAAVNCLRKGKERGWANVVDLETDPDLAPIRKNPAFQELLGQFREPPKKKS
jgi:eukaryotic-like serine/threonine-protein kinase